MKNIKLLLGIILEVLIVMGMYYFMLPPINLHSVSFWGFVFVALIIWGFIYLIVCSTERVERIFSNKRINVQNKFSIASFIIAFAIVIAIIVVNFFASPLFNAKSYSRRISVDETGDFTKDIKEVDFNSLPLLDRDSSEKLGDRVMGQMSDFVSQYYVSDQYTQINYNNDIIRVTSLEYADIIKWFSNRKEGVKGYITVN